MHQERFYYKVVKKSNSTEFIKYLHQLNKNSKSSKIIVILDNASIHRSKKVLKFLERNERIKLKYLPPYSPEYNPVERIWLFLKSNALSAYIEGGIEATIREFKRFVWRWHENWLIPSLKVGLGIWKLLA